MAEQAALSFGGLLRRLRAEALLTQEELAEAAKLSPRSVSDLERGVNRTARKDTAELLADALGLAEPVRGLFIVAALGRGRAEDVLAARDGSTPGPGDQAVRWARGCPYRGLLPFGESDAKVFYGRERLAAELAVKLAARAAGGGLVVVTGASGSGKSSLLRAGLVPILARGQQIPGSERWSRIIMTPTKDPLSELAARLAAVGGPDALAVRDGLARHPEQARLAVRSAGLAAAARRDEQPLASGDDAARLVLIVDQFEQVFTLSPDLGGEATRQAFITALCAAAANPAGPGQEPAALVVIAVRGDFSDRCAAVPELVGPLQDGHFVVGPMTGSELRMAITGPAEAAGVRIDPGLTDTIVGDLRAAGEDRSAGVLPLLSQAMALTWEHREGDRLTGHGYDQAGGVSHAVQTAADRAYDALPAGQQAIAPQVLRAMTVADRDGGLARRPVTRDDLYAGLPDAARGDIDAVLDAFASGRLAVLDADRAQLSHDVLLHAWPRLRRWLEEDQASWILHGQLADAAAAWHDSHRDPSFLYRGAQLATARQAVTRWSASPARSPALTATQRDFLHASQRAAARSSRRRRSALALLALLTALALAAAGFAFSQRAAAIGQRDQADASQVSAEALQYANYGNSDTSLAAQLTLAAYRIQPSQDPDLASRLVNTENTPLSAPPLTVGSSSAVRSVAYSSPERHLMATGTSNGTIRLWDVADPARPRPLGQPLTGGSASSEAVAFSSGGQMLAGIAAGGKAVQLWDIADPAHPQPLLQVPGTDGTVTSVAGSPHGNTLAIGSKDGTILLWNAAHPKYGYTLPTGSREPVLSVAFSPSGQILASNDGAMVQLWSVADPVRSPLSGFSAASNDAVDSIAFSPDGRTLASGNFDGTIQLSDITDPVHPSLIGQLGDTGGTVTSVAFSPSGQTLASGIPTGIQLWDIADPANPAQLGPPLTSSSTSSVDSVAFSPDGHTLASGNDNGTIRLWQLPQTVLIDSSVRVDSVAFSPDRHTLASGDDDGTIRLWDAADPAHPHLLGQAPTGSTQPLLSVAFSSNGHTLASGDYDGTIRLWDVTDPAHPHLLGQPLTGGTQPVSAVAFSPDGHTLAGTYDDGIRLWYIAGPARSRLISQLPDSDYLVTSVAFSPDGHTLASGGYDGKIRRWDVTDPARPRQLGQPLGGSSNAVRSVAFSRDGHTLASSDDGGTIQLWNLNVQSAIERICATAGGLTPGQWNRYISQLGYRSSCAP